jgi:hypothetical protein
MTQQEQSPPRDERQLLRDLLKKFVKEEVSTNSLDDSDVKEDKPSEEIKPTTP